MLQQDTATETCFAESISSRRKRAKLLCYDGESSDEEVMVEK